MKKMSDINSTELNQAIQLNNEGKIKEAIKIVRKFKKKTDTSSKDKLEWLILEGILSYRLGRYKKAFRITEKAFQESQNMGKIFQSIDALIIQCFALINLNNLTKAKEHIVLIEKLLSSTPSINPLELEAREFLIDFVKNCFLTNNNLTFLSGILVNTDSYVNTKTLFYLENSMKIIEKIDKSQRWSFINSSLLLTISRLLVGAGKIGEVLPFILKFEEKLSNFLVEKLYYFHTKSTYLNMTGDFLESLSISDKGLKLNQLKGLNSPFFNVLLQFTKAYALRGLMRWDEAEIIHDQLEDILNRSNTSTTEQLGPMAHIYLNKGYIYRDKGELERALDYARQSCTGFKSVGNKVWMGYSLFLIANIFKLKGELDNAIEYAMRCMDIKETPEYTKVRNFSHNLGEVYYLKGELDTALEYLEQALTISKKIKFKREIPLILCRIGEVFWKKGNSEQALKYLEESLSLSEETNNPFDNALALFWLINIEVDLEDFDKAQELLRQLQHVSDSYKINLISQLYRIANALILKNSARARNRAEAEFLLKEIVEEEIINFELAIIALLNLCDLFLIELRNTSEMEIIEELQFYVTKLLDITEKNRSYSLLSDTYLLQARLALLTLDIKEAQRFLTQAQQIAERWGLNRLVKKISSEFDKLITQLSLWEKLKESDAPLIERIKLAQFDEQMIQMLQKPAILTDHIIEEKVTIHKEKKICLVCKGEASGFAYNCDCGVFYCENCARALTELENVCWVCNAPIDTSKPAKPYKEEKEKIDLKEKKK